MYNLHVLQSRPKELSVILGAYERIGSAFATFNAPKDVGLMSPLLQDIVFALPRVREPIQTLLNAINIRKASLEEKSELWRDESKYPAIRNAKVVGVYNCAGSPALETFTTGGRSS